MRVSTTQLKDSVDAFQLQAAIDELRSLLRFLSIETGNGTPEGVVSANVGTLFLRLDGGASTTLYVKESDDGRSTGWVGK